MHLAPTPRSLIQTLAASDRLLQPADVDGSPAALAHAERRSLVTRLAPGVYLGADHPEHPLSEAAAWSLRHPRAVACLFTAAVHHDLVTAFARGTWLFVPWGASRPRSRTATVHAIQLRERLLDPATDDDNGVQTLRIHGVDLRITGPDRTVVDLFRHRRHVPIEHALTALQRRASASDFRVPTFARLARRVGVWSRIEGVVQGLMLR